MTVADTSTLWLYFNSYDGDYADQARPAARLPEQLAAGARLQRPCRLHRALGRCGNPHPAGALRYSQPGMLLRPEMFVSGKLRIGERAALLVPRSARDRVREQTMCSCSRAAGQYRRTPVAGHIVDETQYAVVGGLDARRPVVTEGACCSTRSAAM